MWRHLVDRCHGDVDHDLCRKGDLHARATADTSAETLHDPNSKHDPVYQVLHETAEFVELRRRFRKFVFPATVAFLLLVPALRGHVELGHRLHEPRRWSATSTWRWSSALLQFVTTFVLAWVYARYMNREVDPLARQLEEKYDKEAMPMSSQTLTAVLFLAVVRAHGRHHLLGQPAGLRHHRLLRRRSLLQRLPERHGRLRRLHVRGVVPRHLGADRAQRVRRLPVLHRLPGGVAGRAAARRRAAAQLRSLHDGRPAGLPDEAAPGAHGRGHLDGRRLDLLPAGADGRCGRARGAAPRRAVRDASRR